MANKIDKSARMAIAIAYGCYAPIVSSLVAIGYAVPQVSPSEGIAVFMVAFVTASAIYPLALKLGTYALKI